MQTWQPLTLPATFTTRRWAGSSHFYVQQPVDGDGSCTRPQLLRSADRHADSFSLATAASVIPFSLDDGMQYGMNFSPSLCPRWTDVVYNSNSRSPWSSFAMNALGTSAHLTAIDKRSRDTVFAMALDGRSASQIAGCEAAFPSEEVLNIMCQLALLSPNSQARHLIHAPTFPLNDTCTELLGAIIATGAVMSTDAVTRDFGLTLQKILRSRIQRRIEDDNRLMRDFAIMQASLLQLKIAIWNGTSEAAQLGECSLAALVTMARRGGVFARSTSTITPEAGDYGDILHQKWLQWAEQEVRKRFAIHVFLHDFEASVCFLRGPLVSYAELSLPLPQARALWEAPSAEMWKVQWMESMRCGNSPELQLTLRDCLQNPTILAALDMGIDSLQANLAMLATYWHMTWAAQQLQSCMSDICNSWSKGNLSISARQTDIWIRIQSLRTTSTDAENVTIISELILVHLHASITDILKISDVKCREEAEQSFLRIRRWTKTTAARQTLWHAGQVIRASRKIQEGYLHDFAATAVYHAGLAFWGYAEASQDSGCRSSQGVVDPCATAWLDGEDDSSIRRWISTGQGHAAIRGRSRLRAETEDGPKILVALVDLLRRGCAGDYHARIVGRVIAYMEDLITSRTLQPPLSTAV